MATDARVTQTPVEALLSEAAGAMRVSQGPLEVLADAATIHARLTQGVIEVLIVGTPTVPILMVGTTYSSVDLPDPSTYYTGFKDGRVLSFGTATRTLSDLTGQWSANDLSCSLADTDRSVRNVLTRAKGLRDTPVIIRMISDAARRVQLIPTIVFRGTLSGWKPRGDLAVDLEYTDAVGLRLTKRGKDRQLPLRTVTIADFPLAPVTSQELPIPIIYGTYEVYEGACPVVYVGLKDIGMGSMHTWVIAGHACVKVSLFLDGVSLYTRIMGEPPLEATWFCPPGQGEPDYSGWTLPTTYVDINNHRYTLIQGKVGATVTGSASGDTLTATGHGLLNGVGIQFSMSKTGTPTLPEPLNGGTVYYVRDKAANTFKVALTPSGDAVDLTTDGTGTFKFDTDPDLVVDGSKTLTTDVLGIEATGDGTGALIVQSFLQYLHFFRNFVLDNYQHGSWPTTPILWETGWSQIHDQSFVTAQAESRRWVTGNGYVGQAYIGPNRKSVSDWLSVWNSSLNCRLGLNRYYQWIVSLLPGALTVAELAGLPRLSDSQDVYRGSFGVEGLHEEAVTRVTASAFLIPKESSTYGGTETYIDRESEADSGAEVDSTLKLDFLASAPQISGPGPTYLSASAEDVTRRWLAFRSGPPIYRTTFQTGLCTYEAIDVGDLFRMTHFAGTTIDGWQDRIIWCESIALDIDQRSVTVTGLDVTHCYEGERTLENTVPPVNPPIVPIGLASPTGFTGSLLDATLGSAYYGTPSTVVYYKLVAVFNSGEESKPIIIGPFTTAPIETGYEQHNKRVHMVWNAYPIAAQTNVAGASVTPTAMRVYRGTTEDFSGAVVKCDLTKYPLPEAPGNLHATATGSGHNHTYEVRQYYYLVGEGASSFVGVTTGEPPHVELDWWEDAAVDQLGLAGVFDQDMYREDGELDSGQFGNFLDDGSHPPYGGYRDPVTPGVNLPLSATSFYDQWPGKADEANNPWVTV